MIRRRVRYVTTLLAVVGLVGLGSDAVGQATSLTGLLQQTWHRYLAASRSGDEAELRAAMSTFRFVTMKNDLAKSGLSLTPDRIKRIAEFAPDISRCQLASVLSSGPTAALLYVRDSDTIDSTGRPRVDYYFMKFVEEAGVWRMDGYQRVNALKFKPDGTLAGFDPKHIQPTYEIDGRILPPPSLLPATR